MRTFTSLRLAEAEELVRAVVRFSRHAPDAPEIAVAVVGTDGGLIAFAAMDRTKPVACELAKLKATTAVRLQRKTSELTGRNPADYGDPAITTLGGGIPIIVNDEVVGGLGVSGRKPNAEKPDDPPQDEELAELAYKELLDQNHLHKH